MDLKQLAEDKNIRDPRKLYQYVRSLGVGPKEVSIKQAAAALRDSTQRELLAPQVRYQGHFAANAPGDQIQADLIDWGAGNTKAKKGGGQFAVVATDVYTRKTEAVPIANKKASTVEAATADRNDANVEHWFEMLLLCAIAWGEGGLGVAPGQDGQVLEV
jgi:hypothetical protein